MNKEEFQTKKNDIDSKIRELKNQKIQLEKEYIESNQGFPVGSKVCITVMAHERYTFWNNERILVPEAKKLAYIADYLYVCDNMVYRECELDFSAIDWEQRRYELAKDIIKAVVADDRGGNSDAIAKYAVNCADALIKRLKEVNNG